MTRRLPTVKLHARIVLLLALSLGAFLLVGIGTISWVLDPAFERLEQDQARANVARVQRALQGELNSMHQKLLDWSNWDDTSDFVRHRTPDYIAGNLNASSLASLDLTFMAFYDLDGTPVWTGGYDAETGEKDSFPELTDRSVMKRFLSSAVLPVEVSGLWISTEGNFLLTARPILNSQGEGPIAGTLIFGRRLDPDFLSGLQKQTEVAFQLEPQSATPASAEPHEIARTDTILRHSVAWPDLTGQPGLEIVVETPRSIAAVGRSTVHLVAVFLFSSAIVDMIVIGLAVIYLITRPIGRLAERVEQVAQSGDLSLRLGWDRRDEIGILATQFDRMIEKLEMSAQHAMAASQAKSHFLANMSHELRTPLNAIIGFSEIIAAQVMGPVGNARYAEYASHIHVSAQHLLRIIADILDFSKVEAGRMQIREAPVDLGDVIGFCRHVLEIRAQTGKVTLSSNVPPSLPAVWGDALKLNQAVLNLMTNAVKFTPPGGSVAASAALRNGDLVIEIKDTGIGMAPDQIPLALEPFGQLENGFDRAFDGTGLGLPLARELIALHDGRLEIESALGKGTTARVILPPDRLLGRRDTPHSVGASAAE